MMRRTDIVEPDDASRLDQWADKYRDALVRTGPRSRDRICGLTVARSVPAHSLKAVRVESRRQPDWTPHAPPMRYRRAASTEITGLLETDGGAARGIRTPDPLITNEVLYQLSYCGPGPNADRGRRSIGRARQGRLIAARPALGKAGTGRRPRQTSRSDVSSSRRNAATSARSTPGAMKLWPMPRARMKVSAPSRTFLSCPMASRMASASPHPPGTA